MFDAQMLTIVNSMQSPVDYDEYAAACVKMDIIPLPMYHYAQKIGLLLVGRARYFDKTDQEIDVLLREEMNKAFTPTVTPPKEPTGLAEGKPCCSDNPPSPSTLSMAMSAGLALARWVASGGKNVSKTEREQRMATCLQCDFRGGARCTVCGCYFQIKSWMATEHCPKQRWPGDETDGL